ncbi:MAG: zinc ribbon domain-containing protein, partial [Candidatus Thorarchaeota archaeon]
DNLSLNNLSSSSQSLQLYYDIMITIIVERIILSLILSFGYVIVISMVSSLLKNDFQRLKMPATNLHQSSISNSVLVKEGFKNGLPKFIPVFFIVLICNILFWLGASFFLIPAIFIGIIFAVIQVVIVLEKDKPVWESFKRSYQLAKSNFIKIFVVTIFIGVIQFFISIIATLFFDIPYSIITGDLSGTLIDNVTYKFLQLLAESVGAPLTIISLTILYYDLKFSEKRRKMGYQYVRSPQSQIQSYPSNPYQSYSPPLTYPTSQSVYPIGEEVECSNCHLKSPKIAKFCAHCGKELVIQPSLEDSLPQVTSQGKICSKCGQKAKRDSDNFCQFCGAKY